MTYQQKLNKIQEKVDNICGRPYFSNIIFISKKEIIPFITRLNFFPTKTYDIEIKYSEFEDSFTEPGISLDFLSSPGQYPGWCFLTVLILKGEKISNNNYKLYMSIKASNTKTQFVVYTKDYKKNWIVYAPIFNKNYR